jgi:NADPH:quinone reductase-like Zn-dependent oxidoreductase
LWYAARERAEIRAETVAAPAAGEVRVRALHGALSRGTERLIFLGRVPESEYGRMRAPHMAGEFPFPVKYGYINVGRVVEGPPELTGRTVFALHPHQTGYTVPADAVVPLPDGVPAARAVLAANMETALNALWDAAPGPADRIAVVGAGVLGALTAWLAGRIPGTAVTLVDVAPERAALARVLGVGFAPPDQAPQDCDLVVHASASAAGLATALRLAGLEATVLELSWYGSGDVPAPLGGAFHSRRLRLVSSQVGTVAASHRPRWDHRRRLAAALALLADPALDALIAPAIAFDDLPARLPALLGPAGGVLCQRIDYPDE